jgi:hypothetical protein
MARRNLAAKGAWAADGSRERHGWRSVSVRVRPSRHLAAPAILSRSIVVGQAAQEQLAGAYLLSVLFVGAFLTIGYTFFFAAENLRAQSLMSGMLSVLVSMVLLVIVVVDHPYAGYVRVTPESLRLVLEEFSALASLPYQ